MAKMLEPPTDSEKFQKLIVIESEREVNELLKSWSIPLDSSTFHTENTDPCKENSPGITDEDTLLKFPRTSHILNLGAATRDDKVLGTSDLARIIGSVSSSEDRSPNLVIEEKMDGANMGVFISKNTFKIMVQNRSHFVSSKYHPQFSPLDRWIDNHSQDLWQILEPGRHILYGEWLYATHSVEYTSLPGWFIAYDLFDKETQTFVSRKVLAEKLAQTSIPHVPVVHCGPINNIEQIKAMVDGPSAFNEARREGIVVRVQDSKDERLVMRAKLVRSDFIAGNERWNKSAKLQTNKLMI
jgi:atypical dual specificity phosphatase